MIFAILFQIVGYLAKVLITVVIIQFVLSLLISFNVVSFHNKFVAAIWQALNAILDPILRPIRRHMPDTGQLDLSPMALIIGLTILQIILQNLARASGA